MHTPSFSRPSKRPSPVDTSYGAPTEAEVLLAEKVCSWAEPVEQVRFVSSGTEATMSAIRLARGFTERDLIIKFAGCYHGHADHLLVQAGSGLATFGIPSSAGVPEAVVQSTLVARYNDLESVELYFKEFGDKIACVILEPYSRQQRTHIPVGWIHPQAHRPPRTSTGRW